MDAKKSFGLEICMAPVAKQRPRLTRQGHAYTPQKTKIAEQQIKDCLIANGAPKFDGPLDLQLVFHVKRPKKQANYFPVTRPDLDNYAKTFFDAANGVLYDDDSQIISLKAIKIYSDEPSIVFKIAEYLPNKGNC